MKFKQLLCDEIVQELEELRRYNPGTEEFKAASDTVVKLIDRAIEIEKTEFDKDYKVDTRDIDNRFKYNQMKDERRDRIIKNLLTALSIGVPAVIAVWGTIKSLVFEEKGTVTTIAGRSWTQALFKLFKKM